jgi:ribosome maturation protein SDO1
LPCVSFEFDELWFFFNKYRAAFGTDKAGDIVKTIVEKGDVELNANERKEAVEKKRAEIVNYIHKYFVDPKTKTPHPVVRIQNALDTLKIRVDPDIPAERQVQEITRRLPEVLPVRKQEMEGTISIPHAFLGQAAGIIKKMAQIRGESYTGEGCTYDVTFVPGDYQPLTQELQKLTQGNFQFDVDAQGMAASQEPETKGKKGGAAKRGGKK